MFHELSIILSPLRLIRLNIFIQLIVIICSHSVATRRLRRNAQPRFLSAPKNVTFTQGSLAVLQCTVQHLGTKTVGWRKDSDEFYLTIGDVVFTQEKRVNVDYSKRTSTIVDSNLVIRNVQREDAGLYECHVSSTKPLTRLVALSVIDPPRHREPIVLTGTEYVENKQPIKLMCNSSGVMHAPDDVDWFKDGIKIKPGYRARPGSLPKLMITKFQSLVDRSVSSELIIYRASPEDAGMYVCRSTNLAVTSIRVHVLTANSSNVKRGTPLEVEFPIKAENPVQIGKQTSNTNPSSGQTVASANLLLYMYVTTSGLFIFGA